MCSVIRDLDLEIFEFMRDDKNNLVMILGKFEMLKYKIIYSECVGQMSAFHS